MKLALLVIVLVTGCLTASKLVTAQIITAMAGEKGALLWVVSAVDSEKQAEYRLDSQPFFDGMAAVGEHLYLVTTDGAVLCFSGAQK